MVVTHRVLLGLGFAASSQRGYCVSTWVDLGFATGFHSRYTWHDDVNHRLLSTMNFLVLRNMALWQQAIIIGALTALAELLEFFGEYLIQDVTFNPLSLWAAVVNCIL